VRVANRLPLFVIIQLVLFLAHWFLYETWNGFLGNARPSRNFGIAISFGAAVGQLSWSASLLAWRSSHVAVFGVLYRISAVWLGVLSFCVLAACSCWTVLPGGRALLGMHPSRRVLVTVLFGLALLASLYGVVNAAWDAR